MIKNKFEISLRDYDKVERRGKISQLKKWWNVFPSFLFSKQIVKVLLELGREINMDSGVDEDEDEKLWKASSFAKITAIETCYLGLVNIMYLKPKAAYLYNFYRRKKKLKIISSKKRYVIGLKEHGGFKIESEGDLERVRKNILFRKDRYDENYSSVEEAKTQPKKKYYLTNH